MADDDNKTLNYKMKLLLDIGQAMMENGADCARVIRDMKRAAVHLRIPAENIQSHITYTTLMLSVCDDERSFTQFRKCMKHGVNLAVLAAVSKLTWRILRGNTSIRPIERAIARIRERPLCYPDWVIVLGAAIGSGGSCKLFGGSWFEALIATIAAFAGFISYRLSTQNAFNPYACAMITGFVATLCAWIIPTVLGLPIMWYALVACTIFLMPGFPSVNAASDMLNRFTTSGMTRAMDTMLIIGGLTFGIAFAILIAGVHNISDVHIQPTDTYLNQAVAAALAAGGFSVMFNTPKKLLAVVALEGIVTMLIRNVIMLEFGLPQAIGSFVAAAVVGMEPGGGARRARRAGRRRAFLAQRGTSGTRGGEATRGTHVFPVSQRYRCGPGSAPRDACHLCAASPPPYSTPRAEFRDAAPVAGMRG